MKQKTASKIECLCLNEVLVKKTWLHTTETNDHSYYRTLMNCVKKLAVHLGFRWQQILRLQNMGH